MRDPAALTLTADGAELVRAAMSDGAIQSVIDVTASLPRDRAGIRLQDVAGLRPLLAALGPIGSVPAALLGEECRPVRAILFDKTPAANWALPWHQDRTIAVAERIAVPGYGPWTTKAGVVHVEPPAELLAGMITVRAHLDPVPPTNAPLLVAPGSHRLGRIAEPDVPAVVRRFGSVACLADPGDIWIYATLVLHASEAAAEPSRRRVLQVDYVVGDLPGGLEWHGV